MPQLTDAQQFGQRLAALRREKGLRERRDVSQAEVARAIKTTPPTYSRLEAGGFKRAPDNATLKALAKYFGVTLSWLWFGEGEQESIPRAVIQRETISERDITAAHQKPSSRSGAGGKPRNR